MARVKRRRRQNRSLPTMLLWDRRQQIRFIEAVERFQSLVNDLTVLVDKKRRRSQAATLANQTGKLGEAGNGNGNSEPHDGD